jgi:hypothetical protein
MKAYLPTATMTATILVLASSALVGTNAMGAPSSVPPASAAHGPQATPTPISFKFKCVGYGNEVIISNISAVPVPAGMVIIWQAPKTAANGVVPASNAISGSYTLQKPMAPQGGITLNAPPPATGGGPDLSGGVSGSDPGGVGSLLMGLRSCTASAVDPRTIAPVPMVRH